jgi:hypothetical protein
MPALLNGNNQPPGLPVRAFFDALKIDCPQCSMLGR